MFAGKFIQKMKSINAHFGCGAVIAGTNASKMINLLTKILPYKEIGWHDIGETFYRFQLLKTRWFNIYLHWLDAPNEHPQCHDHPWDFWAIILKGGYYEFNNGVWTFRKPGSFLYRPATFAHNVVTPKPNWSIIFTSAKKREWSMISCEQNKSEEKK